jgi:hypothetical protein
MTPSQNKGSFAVSGKSDAKFVNSPNNYGFNDEGIKNPGPDNQNSTPLVSITFTISYRIVQHDASGNETQISSDDMSESFAHTENGTVNTGPDAMNGSAGAVCRTAESSGDTKTGRGLMVGRAGVAYRTAESSGGTKTGRGVIVGGAGAAFRTGEPVPGGEMYIELEPDDKASTKK